MPASSGRVRALTQADDAGREPVDQGRFAIWAEGAVAAHDARQPTHHLERCQHANLAGGYRLRGREHLLWPRGDPDRVDFAQVEGRQHVGEKRPRRKIVMLSAASLQVHHQPPTRSCDREIGGAWSAFPSSSEYANSAGIPPVWRRPRSSREQSRRPRHRGQARPSPLRRARPARWSRYSVITASRQTSSPVAAPQVCSPGLLPSG